jgi:hypothetical protein
MVKPTQRGTLPGQIWAVEAIGFPGTQAFPPCGRSAARLAVPRRACRGRAHGLLPFRACRGMLASVSLRRRLSQAGRALTIRPSRRRFAARLNSGVSARSRSSVFGACPSRSQFASHVRPTPQAGRRASSRRARLVGRLHAACRAMQAARPHRCSAAPCPARPGGCGNRLFRPSRPRRPAGAARPGWPCRIALVAAGLAGRCRSGPAVASSRP